jgi:EAL and modified HD-GYP domain-containing signal transduction protein
MARSVLDSVTLGYTLLWNQKRQRCGVRLLVDSASPSAVDARHLLSAMAELWPSASAGVLLSVQTPALLQDLLEHLPARGVWLEIPNATMADAPLAGKVRKAAQRGVHLVWRGEPGQIPTAAIAPHFHAVQRALTPQEALNALRMARHAGTAHSATPSTPRIFEGMASQALVEHALDREHAWGVLGWPSEEILYNHRLRQIQPSRTQLQTLVQAIDADESLESLEQRMGDEPLLNYRFLRYANSAALGLRQEVDSVRQGLLTMGLLRLRAWLVEQLPNASSDMNLDPVRASMVLRARTMERLADAGAEEALRREVFLCGLFSQLDLLLGEPLGTALHHLPLPGRVASAILGQTGPYTPWLDVATALESGSTHVIREVCKAHDMRAEEVNRALLRTLAQPPSAAVAPRASIKRPYRPALMAA